MSASSRPLPQEDDGALVSRLQAGDDEAYDLLARRHAGRLMATARRLLGDEGDARDAVRDAFRAAFRGIGSLPRGASLSAWLVRLVVDAALAKIRAWAPRAEPSIEHLLPAFGADGRSAVAFEAWSAEADAPRSQEWREEARVAVDALPAAHRLVLLLCDVENLDPREVAQGLGETPEGVRVRLHRARQALRTLLAPTFERPPLRAAGVPA